MGAMISISYATVYNDIDGIVSVSHVIDNKKADIILCQNLEFNLYGKALLNSLTRNIKKSDLYTEEEKKKICNIKTSAEFHDLVSAKKI